VFLQCVLFWQVLHGTFGHPSTSVPEGRAGTAAVEAEAAECGAAVFSPTARLETAFGKPCKPPAGRSPTGMGPRTPPRAITIGGLVATGGSILFDDAAAG
jgi:hypothetical protein